VIIGPPDEKPNARLASDEQRAVLSGKERIRIVQASPGSGKTWLIAEAIRQELGSMGGSQRGIAALSFTRVGGSEIRAAVGCDLDLPHFVGTIDAFVFRYVVRPFVREIAKDHVPPRLLPADCLPEKWTKRPDNAKWTVTGVSGAEYNPLEVRFVEEAIDGNLIMTTPRPHKKGVYDLVPANDRNGLLDDKRTIWKKFGLMTHSDVSYIASKLLRHKASGAAIRAIIMGRFPMLIVDELQDTGFFLAQCIKSLLSEESSRGLLVGDPDQAIYEFNGAVPQLFQDFSTIPGSRVYSMETSRRCPTSVTTCAMHLKETPGALTSRPGDSGRAFLVTYTDMRSDVLRLSAHILSVRPTAIGKIIVRNTSTMDTLLGRKGKTFKLLHCPPITHLLRGVVELRKNVTKKAAASAQAAIDLAIFKHEGVSSEELELRNISEFDWKYLALKCLVRSAGIATSQTLYAWQIAAGLAMHEEFQKCPWLRDLLPENVLKPKQVEGWDTNMDVIIPTDVAEEQPGFPVETIHGVKGETHDVTMMVFDDARSVNRCPSHIWWSDDAEHKEEKRIAYVGMTRSRADLLLLVSTECAARLSEKRDFSSSWVHLSIDEAVGHFSSE